MTRYEVQGSKSVTEGWMLVVNAWSNPIAPTNKILGTRTFDHPSLTPPCTETGFVRDEDDSEISPLNYCDGYQNKPGYGVRS